MRIGTLAQHAGVRPPTIRYYEEIGLLPEPDRTAAGYRDYPDAAVSRLAFIRAAQAIGFTLAEVAEILALRDQNRSACPHVVRLLDRRAEELADRIQAMQEMRRDLVDLARRARSGAPAPDCDYCHIIEGRHDS